MTIPQESCSFAGIFYMASRECTTVQAQRCSFERLKTNGGTPVQKSSDAVVIYREGRAFTSSPGNFVARH
jgi:hypothetical protein